MMMDALTATSPLAAPMPGALAAGNLMPNPGLSNMAAIDKVAGDFEGMFMAQMLQPMFEGLQTDPVFGGGHGEEVMRSFMVQEYGKSLVRHGHLGLADEIKKSMIRTQEKNSRSAATTPAATVAAYRQAQDTTLSTSNPVP